MTNIKEVKMLEENAGRCELGVLLESGESRMCL